METRARFALIGVFMLAVILASFAFVYWLENKGGFAQRAYYQIQFEDSVSGLLVGSAVLFNGIRVGEVTELRLDAARPDQVLVTIGVDHNTPIRSDTAIGVEMQGLTGGAAVTLAGGTPGAPDLQSGPGQMPLLVASPGAGQDWTTLARNVLRKLETILSENADNLHSAIANINTFADALARNSDRVDGILAGLERLTGGGSGSKEQVPIYDLVAPKDLPKPETAPDWQLLVPEPSALLAVNTDRMRATPEGGAESIDIADAKWSDNVPILLQEKFIQSFENAGYSRSVSRPRDGFEAGYQLILDIRGFSLVTGEQPEAMLEFEAKVFGPDGRIVAAKTFRETAPASSADAAGAAASMNQAFAKAARALVPWTAEAIDKAPPAKPAESPAAPEFEPDAATPDTPSPEMPPDGGGQIPESPS